MKNQRGINIIRKWIGIFCAVIMVAWFFILDYNDLSWETNKISYLLIGSSLLLFLANFKHIKIKELKNNINK